MEGGPLVGPHICIVLYIYIYINNNAIVRSLYRVHRLGNSALSNKRLQLSGGHDVLR